MPSIKHLIHQDNLKYNCRIKQSHDDHPTNFDDEKHKLLENVAVLTPFSIKNEACFNELLGMMYTKLYMSKNSKGLVWNKIVLILVIDSSKEWIMALSQAQTFAEVLLSNQILNCTFTFH